MTTLSNKKAFTLTELMIVSALTAVLLATTMAGFVLVKQIFAVNIAQTMFQRDAAVIMSMIRDGKSVPNGLRLSEAETVTFYDDTGKLMFVGTDSTIQRTYSLSANHTELYYTDTDGNNIILYTAPSGAVINLIFGTLNVGAPLCVSIYVSVSQTIDNKTVLGALQSSVYLRNHPS